MCKRYFWVVLLFIGVVTVSCKEDRKPNVVYILADDLGIGDVSCYNPEAKFQTPNIDKLSQEGMRFTDAHSGSAVCTPTRYGILTGRYSWRGVMKKGVTWSYDSSIIEPNRVTVADMFQTNGYKTACIGKWHLGLNWAVDSSSKWPVDFTQKVRNSPNDYGFDYSYVIPASLDIPPYVYLENDEVTAQPDRETENKSKYGWWRLGPTGSDFSHEKVLSNFSSRAVDYINENKDEPFFLYLPLAAPHTPIIPDAKHKGKSEFSEYGDFVMMVDEVVGNVTAALKANGLDENTLIIFTSDNGCAPLAGVKDMEAKGHFSSMQYRGYKAEAYEGGHRIPFIARWANQIAPGSLSKSTICLTDFMATCAAILNIDLADDTAEDSYDLSPLLSEVPFEGDFREATVHHAMDGSFAIRKGDWKLILTKGSGGWKTEENDLRIKNATHPFQLYNIKTDDKETENMVESNPEKAEELRLLMEKYILEGRSTPGEKQAYVKSENWPGTDWMSK
ncbi:sulfatase family protein [Arcticibacterium luteifluviistationis]|uniref:Arylsulfatase n=1 Tax=Arcticibacterium luteifluviistationis TaxID=1784714 RepID=A0A2Z4GDF9_9BACT|nr:arylsulfatase [Arcticibacterium luteifluviistationis]AWV99349.1 arylsulfatase [Arcticibacterium luteifluviistationis]